MKRYNHKKGIGVPNERPDELKGINDWEDVSELYKFIIYLPVTGAIILSAYFFLRWIGGL